MSWNYKVRIVTAKIIDKSEILILDRKLLTCLVFDYAPKDIRFSEELHAFLHIRKDTFYKKTNQTLVDNSCA